MTGHSSAGDAGMIRGRPDVMTHCVEFWKKWKKEPNFCGLSPQAISEIKAYLETVEKICKLGIPEEEVYESLPEGAGGLKCATRFHVSY